MGKESELWDIYDINKEVTGRTMRRNDFTMKDGDYHLTVIAVVSRPDNTFLITKRVMTKKWAPGHWEISGGGVMAGEDSYTAVLREVREETGLDVSNAEGGLKFTYRRDNPDEGDNYFVDVYRFTMDFTEADVVLQEDETADFMIATLDQIKEIADRGEFLHYNSIKQVFED